MTRNERCEECGEVVELNEADVENPLTGDRYDRYKCPCEETTVLDFDHSIRAEPDGGQADE
jgi:hypothetical protein